MGKILFDEFEIIRQEQEHKCRDYVTSEGGIPACSGCGVHIRPEKTCRIYNLKHEILRKYL